MPGKKVPLSEQRPVVGRNSDNGRVLAPTHLCPKLGHSYPQPEKGSGH